jgi:hypothetical protein
MSVDELYELVRECNNPKLVDPKEAPNANKIIHIYNDGEITEQKGGFAYLQRSEITIEFRVGKNYDPLKFPCVYSFNGATTGYAIVTLEDAHKIRSLMIKLKT